MLSNDLNWTYEWHVNGKHAADFELNVTVGVSDPETFGDFSIDEDIRIYCHDGDKECREHFPPIDGLKKQVLKDLSNNEKFMSTAFEKLEEAFFEACDETSRSRQEAVQAGWLAPRRSA